MPRITPLSARLPQLAPLPLPMAEHLLEYQNRLYRISPPLRLSPEEALEQFTQEYETTWNSVEQQIKSSRCKVYELIECEKKTISGERQLSTESILKMLATTKGTVTTQTLSRWRENGLLRYQRWNEPDSDSIAALLISSMIDGRQRGWLPPGINQDEPYWWCWRQDQPDAPVESCSIPFPDDLPPSALLWTPWCGAAWSPTWLKVGKIGAIRWAGTHIQDGKLLWAVNQEDLQHWVPEIMSLGSGLDVTPEILHILANVALLNLTRSRLK